MTEAEAEQALAGLIRDGAGRSHMEDMETLITGVVEEAHSTFNEAK